MKNKVLSILSFLLTGFIFFKLSTLKPPSNVKADEGEQKIIYLTFDDGPSYKITNEILDILKEKNVKATFFLIGYKVENRREIVERIYKEGHGIGLHSYTHNIKKLYKNDESFIEEMEQTQDAIYNIIGIKSTIIRFPTGSKGHLNSNLHKKLKEKGFKVFDWNARISDGFVPSKSPNILYKEAVKSSSKWKKVFLLMHCAETDKNTIKALPNIIDYFKGNGYEFRIIDQNTEEYYFKYKK